MPLNPSELMVQTCRPAAYVNLPRLNWKKIIHMPTGLYVECKARPRREETEALAKLDKMVEENAKKGDKAFKNTFIEHWELK